jgi:CRISPR-associated Cas5-like protein
VRALHVRLEGLTASFRHPLVFTGTQVSTPMPAYSNVLGMISACVGHTVEPADVGRVGFEFHCKSHDLELERRDRWEMKSDRLQPVTKKKVPGVLRRHEKGIIEEVRQGVGMRQVYWEPLLDLYLTAVALADAFERPAATPRFGRSQDLAWIRWVREVDLHATPRGALGPTLIPPPNVGLPGWTVRLAESFVNTKYGRPRRPGPIGRYQAMLPTGGELRFEVERSDLFHPSDAERESDIIYLHRWLEE